MFTSIIQSGIECRRIHLIQYLGLKLYFSPIEIIFKGSLYLIDEGKNNLAVRRLFILTNQALFMLKKEFKELNPSDGYYYVSLKINVNWALVTDQTTNSTMDTSEYYFKHSITVSLDNQFLILFTNKSKVYENLMESFRKTSILTDFKSRYELVQKISSGTKNPLFRIKNKQNGTFYAGKLYSKNRIKANQELLDKIINEIEILRELEGHPGINRLEGIFEDKTSILIVKDWIPGSSLKNFFGDFSINDLYLPLSSILSTLSDLESKGISHLNIKPENLILTNSDLSFKDSELKLVGFCYARSKKLNLKKSIRIKNLAYIAPELLEKENIEVGPSSDIYSLGLILFELITGESPFENHSFISRLDRKKEFKVNYYSSKFISAPLECIFIRSKPSLRNASISSFAENNS